MLSFALHKVVMITRSTHLISFLNVGQFHMFVAAANLRFYLFYFEREVGPGVGIVQIWLVVRDLFFGNVESARDHLAFVKAACLNQ